MHNYPGMPVGQFGMRAGPMMAAADHFTIDIEGVGAHAARPHLGVDTVLVGAQIVNQLQSIVSRNVDPLEVGGGVDLPVPGRHDRQRHSADRATARHRAQPGAVCADLLEKRMREIVEGTAQAARRQGEAQLPARLSGAQEPRRANRVRRFGRRRDRRQGQGEYRARAGDGGGGFLLHAQRAARAPSSSSAMATAPGCTTRPIISTTT